MTRFQAVGFGNLILASVGLGMSGTPWAKWLILTSAAISLALACWMLRGGQTNVNHRKREISE